MAAPVRYLSGRQQQQKIGIEGSTQNEKVLEVVGRAGIGTTAFEPGVGLEVRGDQIVTGILTVGSVEVSTTSTFTGNIDANGNLDVDGHTELDDVNVSGASTFTGAADFNGDIDVDGHTELDDVNVSGASTFTGAADFNGNLDVDGHTELDDVNIAGVLTAITINATTFVGNGDFVDIDVDGQTELDNLNVSGVSTFVGVATFSTNDVYVAQRLFVGGVEVGGTTNTFAGINTFTDTTDNTLGNSNTGAVQLDGGLGVDKNVTIGAGLSVAGNAGIGSLNVVGVSTFGGLVTVTTGDVYIAQRLFVGGLEVEGSGSENTFTGINTFTNQTDNTLGDTNTGSLQGNGGLGIDKNASFGSTVFVQNAIGINSTAPIGQFDVNGHTELDDVNVSGVITATTFNGNLVGFDYLQAPFGSTVTFTVTVASKDATHRYNGTGSGSAYLINGVQAPFLTLTPGRTYRFTNDNTGSHPLKFYLEADKTTEYTSGVNFQNSYTEITVSDETPTVLHYQCTAHGYMGNAIQTNSNVVNTNYAATLRDSLTVSGDINANGNIVGDNSTNISGINQATATTFVGNLTGTASTATIATYTSEWILESGNGSDYGISGPGLIGTENDPTFYLTRGEKYKFTNNTGGHPFRIQSTPNGSAGTQYNDGITNNDAGNGTTLLWDVQFDSPDILYYQCTTGGHGGMGGKIYIGNSGSSINIDGHIETDTLNVSGLSTFIGAADFNGNVDIDGHTELDNLNVSGVSTFAGNIDVNAALDVSGNITGSGDLTLTDTDAGSAAGPELKLYRNSASADDADYIGQIKFAGESDTGVERNYAKITGKILDASNTSEDGILEFAHVRAGSQTITGRWRSDSLQLLNSTNFSVDGTSTFTGNVDANGGLDVSGSTLTAANGLVANSAQISDLTSGRVVLAGSSGELEDNSKLTFNGTTLTVAGDASFNGNVTIGGTLTSEDKTNVDSIGLVTARSGVRISAGGLVVTSGVSTFTDNIIGNLTGTATTATNLAGGDTGDIPYQSANGTTTFVDATGVGAGLVLMWGGSNPIWSPVSGASGNFGGITLLEEGSVVGSAGSVTGLNFVGNNVTATAPSGIANGVVTLSDTPTFDSLKVTGISTIPNVSGVTTFSDIVNVGTGITFYASSGIISATKFFGSGENLTDLINQRIEGIRILDEGVQVGSGTTFTNLNFVGNGVVATGIGTTGIITITDTTFEADAQQNLYAGTDAGAASDADTLRNIAIGCKSGCSLNEGDDNVFLGTSSGACVTSGSCNVFMGFDAGKFTTCGSSNIAIGPSAGYNSPGGDNNIFLGIGAGRQVSTGENNIFLGQNSGGQNASAPTTGINNISLGRSSGNCLTSGSSNIFFGKYSGTKTTTGCYNIFFGQCTASGDTITGNNNIAIGCDAGNSLTSGTDNIFLGQCTGYSIAGGDNNIAIGEDAGKGITSGCDNIFLGQSAGEGNTTGCYNIFFGKFTAGQTTVTGGCNIAMGRCAGYKLTSGCDNVFLGYDAGYNSADAGKNVFIGQQAGCTNTSGDSNIAIGCQVSLPSATGDKQLAIGNGSDRWIAGDSSFNVTVSTASTFSSAGLNVTGVVTATDFNATSDARLKTNVQVIPDPLDKIVRIDGVSFNWIKDNKPSMGVIADNIQEVLPDLVSDGDPKTVNYNGLIGLLIEVVKDQQTQINSLNERLSQLE